MWQLRQRWQYHQTDEARHTERVTLESFRVRRLLTVLVVFGVAADAVVLAVRFVHPFSYTAIGLSALGGVALALLLTVIPAQALRVLLRGAISIGLLLKRRRLRRLIRMERAALLREEDGPFSEALLVNLAVVDYLRGDLEAAEHELERGVELASANGCLSNNLAVLLTDRGQYERAAEMFAHIADECHEAMALNCALVAPLLSSPRVLEELIAGASEPNPTAFNNIGVSYARQGDWDTASEWFTAALAANPALPAAHANLGLVAFRNGQLQEAADNIMLANREAPNEPAFASYLSVILAAAGQVEQARFYARRARRVDPASFAVGFNTSTIEAVGGQWQVAERGLQRLLGLGSGSADLHFNLGLTKLASQDATGAAASAASAIALGDTSAEAYTVLAVALWDAGRHAEALSHFITASSAPDATPLTASNLSRALLLQGQLDRALKTLEEARARWPEDLALGFDLATAILAWGAAQYQEEMPLDARQALLAKIQRCYPEFESAIRREGDVTLEARVNMGLYLYMLEQFEAAAEQFEAAFRMAPTLRELQFLAGTALGREGEKQTLRTDDGDFAPTAAGRQFLRRAIPLLESCVEIRDIVVPASYNLSRCLYVLKEYDRSLAMVRKALRHDSDQELNSLAALSAARQAQRLQLIHKTQMLSEARRDQMRKRALELLNMAVHYFRQALLRDEMDPTSHGNLGVAYMLRNGEHDVEAALRHWERMRAIGGGSMERRYTELAQIGNLADPGRVGFDDRNARLQGLQVLRWLAVPAPRPGNVRFLMEPIAVQLPWRLVAEAPRLQAALRLRDEVAAGELRLARLRV